MIDIPPLPEFPHFFTTGKDPAGVPAAHLHADFNFPNTCVCGNVAVTTLGDKVSQDEWRFTVAWAEPTPRGFVVAGLHEEAAVGGGLVRSRMLSLVTVDAGHITEVGDYCTGPV